MVKFNVIRNAKITINKMGNKKRVNGIRTGNNKKINKEVLEEGKE